MATINATASAILDQAAQKLLDAVYEEFKIANDPIIKDMMSIKDLPEHAKYGEAENVLNRHSPDLVAHMMIKSLKSNEERKSALAAYCEARHLLDAMGDSK